MKNNDEISKEEKMLLINDLPKFEYHPNIYENDIVEFKKGKCNCCNKEVNVFVSSMYCNENVECICMNCIKDGLAAKKFNGTFIQYAENITDSNKREILLYKTPGYVSWQGEYWLSCCDDYCEYIGDVGIEELNNLNITDEVIDEFCEKFKIFDSNMLKENLIAKGSVAGYLFKCKHCNKYHLYVDME